MSADQEFKSSVILLSELSELFEQDRLPTEGIAATCRRLATRLNQFAPSTRHWGWQYIHQVLHKNLNPSVALSIAISQAHSLSQKSHIPSLDTVIVLATPGTVIQNSIILSQSKICQSNNCSIVFIPINSNQKYCSPECAKLAKKRRLQIRKSTAGMNS